MVNTLLWFSNSLKEWDSNSLLNPIPLPVFFMVQSKGQREQADISETGSSPFTKGSEQGSPRKGLMSTAYEDRYECQGHESRKRWTKDTHSLRWNGITDELFHNITTRSDKMSLANLSSTPCF